MQPEHAEQATGRSQDRLPSTLPQSALVCDQLTLPPDLGPHAGAGHSLHDALGRDPTRPRCDSHPADEDVERNSGFPADHLPDLAFQDGHFLGAIHTVNLEVESG